MKTARKAKAVQTGPIRIDLGCGPKKFRGQDPAKPDDSWIGLDKIAFPGVDHVLNIGTDTWPFDDGSVAEAYTCHFFEHLDQIERVHFANELHRVLAPGAKCLLIAPHWSSCRAYGDPTHAWPPVSEFTFYYLDRDWRLGNDKKSMPSNAPHTDIKHWKQGFSCDFNVVVGYGLNPDVLKRSTEYVQTAMMHFKEVIFDVHVTLTKK